MTAGAGAAGEGAGRETRGRVPAGRAGAGVGRRAGLGVVFFGAVTVTSGRVSDTWPQAGPGEVSTGNAPTVTAPKSRRLKTRSRDEPRLITPHAPNITPQNFPKGILSYFSPYRLGKFWQNGCEHLAMCSVGHTCEICVPSVGPGSHRKVGYV